jgi:hypothetical protein
LPTLASHSHKQEFRNVKIGISTQRITNPQVTLNATLELDLEMNDLYLPVAEFANEELQHELEGCLLVDCPGSRVARPKAHMALQWRWKLYNANAGKSGAMATVRQQAIEIYLEKEICQSSWQDTSNI